MFIALAACSRDDRYGGLIERMRAREAGLAQVLAAIARDDRPAAIRGWHEVCPDEPEQTLLAMFIPRCAQLAMAMECGEMAFFDRPVAAIPSECRAFASGLRPGAPMLLPYGIDASTSPGATSDSGR